MFTKKQFLLIFIAAILLAACFVAYSFYSKTEIELSKTTMALEATQKELFNLQASTTAAIQNETKLITNQSQALKASQSNQS